MIASLMIALACTPGALQGQVYEYKSQEAGLGITFGPEWKVLPIKGRNKSGMVKLSFGEGQAVLELFALPYSGDTSIWLKGQRLAAESMKREVLFEREEEILGVPLLVVQSAWDGSSGRQNSLAGMIYARAARKLMFRLEASENSFSDANQAFRVALQSLRTLDGKTPTAEEPFRKQDPAEFKKVKPALTPLVLKDEGKPASATVQTQEERAKLDLTLAGKSVAFSYPSKLKVEKKGEVWIATTAEGENLEIRFASSLDSDLPGTAYRKAWSATLDEFDGVVDRQDATFTEKPFVLNWVWRIGKGTDGKALFQLHAVGEQEDFYFLVKLKGGEVSAETRSRLEQILKSLRIEGPKA